MQAQKVMDEFKNEPFTDFSDPENAAAMTALSIRSKPNLAANIRS
jgi:hypothetical protein